jgi:hypothetical protein
MEQNDIERKNVINLTFAYVVKINTRFKPVDPEIHLNNNYRTSSYLTENTLRPHPKYQ